MMEQKFYWFNPKITQFDLDSILVVGYGQFIKSIQIIVNKKIISSTHKDKMLDDLLKNGYTVNEGINNLLSAITDGGFVYSYLDTRNEERYHLFKKIFALVLFSDRNKLYKFLEISKEDHVSLIFSILPYAENMTLNATHLLFRERIIDLLEAKEDDGDLIEILNEVKYLWEYEHIVYILDHFGNERYRISELPKRDRKKEYRKKEKLNKEKEKILKFIKAHNLNVDTGEIESLNYQESESYEVALKDAKNLLCSSLISLCGTGKKRAEIISKIMDFI